MIPPDKIKYNTLVSLLAQSFQSRETIAYPTQKHNSWTVSRSFLTFSNDSSDDAHNIGQYSILTRNC
ncbi:unnamed protein product [Fasciola hepatica]|uniref:Uncharacterized protein n=1 Tax=Fasciola hepatica TaxID=6192 RepID=A0ABC9HHD4_FASHE